MPKKDPLNCLHFHLRYCLLNWFSIVFLFLLIFIHNFFFQFDSWTYKNNLFSWLLIEPNRDMNRAEPNRLSWLWCGYDITKNLVVQL